MHITNIPNIKENVPLAPYTNLKVGGPARYFFEARNNEDIPGLLKAAHEDQLPVLILGGGCNILISDEGFPGLVLLNNTNRIEFEDTKVIAEGGVKLPLLIAKTLEQGLVGLEYWVGIPGTVGASVRGNAGIKDHEMSDFLVEAAVSTMQGQVKVMSKDDLHFSYRHSLLKDEPGLVLSATLQLQTGDVATAKLKMREIHETRLKKQPVGKSCGSFFKNPSPDKAAGWLIDQCGLKGFQIGGAKVSELHGNFLMNAGGATATDFLQLDEHVKKAVKEKFGIELQEEVQIIK